MLFIVVFGGTAVCESEFLTGVDSRHCQVACPFQWQSSEPAKTRGGLGSATLWPHYLDWTFARID